MDKERNKILIVDDMQINRSILRQVFCDSFDVLEAGDGLEALDIIQKHKDELAAILLDIIMPRLDGFGVLNILNENELIKTIPVIFITVESDADMAQKGYALGISDLVYKPFNPEIVFRRVSNVVDLFSYKNNLEQKVAKQMDELREQEKRIREFNQSLIEALSSTVEFRSFATSGQAKRMPKVTAILLEGVAAHYGIDQDEIETIASAASLHDIGKIAIPDEILLKPSSLSEDEFEIMKTHTQKGCEILDRLSYFHDRQYYTYCHDICKYHHERWDGSGYPSGLVGDATPIWAQAAGLADAYEALTTKRVYADAFSHERALSMILSGECGKFNPLLIDSLQKNAKKLKKQA